MNLQFTTTKDAKTYVTAKMQEILRDYGVTTIVPWTTRVSDIDYLYNLDSLDQIEFIMCLEEELEKELSDDVLEKCKTIDDLLNVCIEDFKIANPDVVTSVQSVNVVAPRITVAPPKVPSVPPYQNDIGVLLLPSLENHGRLIQIKSVSVSEALELVDQFTQKVRASRKTKEYKTFTGDVSNMQLFSNIIDSTQMYDTYVKDRKYLDADLSSLFESKVPKTRGLRPVFVSQTVVGVGTTVVYNPNWATVNFEDDTVLGILQKIQAKYQKSDEEDENSSYYNSYDSSW